MEKFKKILMKFNFKKIAIGYAILAALFMAVSTWAYGNNFMGRMQTAIEQRINDPNTLVKGNNYLYYDDDFYELSFDFDDLTDLIELTPYDLKLIAAIGIGGFVMIMSYWVLVVLFVMKKSYEVGADPLIFGGLAVFINIGAILILYIYAKFKGTCPSCRRIVDKDSEYCTECGTSIKDKCNCGEYINRNNKFCKNCGKRNRK